MAFLFDIQSSLPIQIPLRKISEEEWDNIPSLLTYSSIEYESSDDTSSISSDESYKESIGTKKTFILIVAKPFFTQYTYTEYTARSAIDSFTRDFYHILNYSKMIALRINHNTFYIYRLNKIRRKNTSYKTKYTFYFCFISKKDKYEDMIPDVVSFISG